MSSVTFAGVRNLLRAALFVGLAATAATAQTLPPPWSSTDLGAPAVPGAAATSFTIFGGGTDIWDVADQFRFVHQPVSGDAEIVARVASLSNTNRWAKSGVMFRESLTADAAHAMMIISAGSGYAFQRRPGAGALSLHTAGSGGRAPGWVRLVRRGDRFEAYQSADGRAWTLVGTETIPMGGSIYVGLAVTGHDANQGATSVIDNVTLTSGPSSGPPSNQPPAVTITQPSNGMQVTAPATVSITATATDPEHRLTSVQFYVEGNLISTDSTAPYAASWDGSAAGTYSLTAVAHDADGGSTTSNAVSLRVSGAANQPPVVALTRPANNAKFNAPATIGLAATASDPNGSVTRVEFIQGTTLLGTDTSSPYSFDWTDVGAGSYRVRAVAYDNSGASTSSATATVTVTGAPSPAPRAVIFVASADHARSVTSYRLSIYAADANPATATPVATSDLGKPAPAANNDITVDRASFFAGLSPGNYLATVAAIGAGGQTQSSSVAFTR
jgi:Bacterial Ig domain